MQRYFCISCPTDYKQMFDENNYEVKTVAN